MRLLLIRVLTALLLSSPVLPASVIITHSGPESGVSADNNTLGFDFTVGPSDILLTALGFWDEGSDGLINSHTVGIWDSLGASLGDVAVPAGSATPLENGFRFMNLTMPVLLSAGQTYVLGASYLQKDSDHNSFIAEFDAAVISGRARWQMGLGFAFPTLNADYSGATVGPNARFTVMPETSSVLLIALAARFLYPRRRIEGAE